jgi:MYXO-CTERM domain-containing protein
VQMCLNEEEGSATIDAQMDAAITPETFNPKCDMTFNVVARGADYNDVFGWYNVERDADGNSIKPDVADLHTFILGNEDPPFTRALAVRDDPDYLGGEIGFFIATGSPTAEVGGPPSGHYNIFYSEREHNPPEPGQAEPSIHDLIWQSVAHDDSFYFGWEDLLESDSTPDPDNDNDFDDIFTRVSGIQCAGGGAACETDLEGICKDGTMQCQQGELACVPALEPRDETCNALDDDCNGETDDGDGLCEDDFICDRGKCVPKCSTGEFRCSGGLVCSAAGACVDPRCEEVECPEGQICLAGECIDGCADVTCPYGEVCRIGTCVDPCESVNCDDGYSCHLGICVDCDCAGCDDGQTCSSDVCIEDACVDVACGAGTHCVGGACVDDCEGVTCPGGAACVGGACEEPVTGSGGGSANGSGGGPTVSGGTTGVVVGTGGSAASGATGSGAESGEPVGSRTPDEAGCGCRVTGSGSSLAAWLTGAALALVTAARRRRRN